MVSGKRNNIASGVLSCALYGADCTAVHKRKYNLSLEPHLICVINETALLKRVKRQKEAFMRPKRTGLLYRTRCTGVYNTDWFVQAEFSEFLQASEDDAVFFGDVPWKFCARFLTGSGFRVEVMVWG